MGLSVAANLDWHNRKPEKFIDQIIANANVVQRFDWIDGVKSKVALPIYDATLVYHNDLCTFDPRSTASIDEKEMTVTTYKWDFQNCKAVLETEYRSMLLRKGQLNDETMDMDFADWVFDRFAKLNGNKILTLASAGLVTKLDADIDSDINTETIVALTSANILDEMEDCYEAMTDNMLAALYNNGNDADRTLAPVIFLGSAAYRAYQIAVAAQTTTYDLARQADGSFLPYFGMEVVHFPSLAANKIVIAAPQNIAVLTDDMRDPMAIQSLYEPRTNTLDIWGQFKFGIDYKNGAEIVYGATA